MTKELMRSLAVRRGLVFGGAATLLLLAAGGAFAQSAWSGSGSATLTSTPAPYGGCTGTGTSQLSLSGTSSSLYGTLTIDITSYSSGCSGSFSTGPCRIMSRGTCPGNLVLSDSYSDTISGTLNGGSLSLSLTEPTPTASGGSCATFCHTVIEMPMTGTGDLAGAGGLGSLSFDYASQSTAIAATGLVFGLIGLGLAAASFPGSGAGGAGRGASSLEGAGRGGFAGSSSGREGTDPSRASIPRPGLRRSRWSAIRRLRRPPGVPRRVNRSAVPAPGREAGSPPHPRSTSATPSGPRSTAFRSTRRPASGRSRSLVRTGPINTTIRPRGNGPMPSHDKLETGSKSRWEHRGPSLPSWAAHRADAHSRRATGAS